MGAMAANSVRDVGMGDDDESFIPEDDVESNESMESYEDEKDDSENDREVVDNQEEQHEQWAQVLERRKQDCQQIKWDDQLEQKIIEQYGKDLPDPPADALSPMERIPWMLMQHVNIASNPNIVPASRRRQSWLAIKEIFQAIDQELQKKKAAQEKAPRAAATKNNKKPWVDLEYQPEKRPLATEPNSSPPRVLRKLGREKTLKQAPTIPASMSLEDTDVSEDDDMDVSGDDMEASAKAPPERHAVSRPKPTSDGADQREHQEVKASQGGTHQATTKYATGIDKSSTSMAASDQTNHQEAAPMNASSISELDSPSKLKAGDQAENVTRSAPDKPSDSGHAHPQRGMLESTAPRGQVEAEAPLLAAHTKPVSEIPKQSHDHEIRLLDGRGCVLPTRPGSSNNTGRTNSQGSQQSSSFKEPRDVDDGWNIRVALLHSVIRQERKKNESFPTKSVVCSKLRQFRPDLFPDRDSLRAFVYLALDQGVIIEKGQGADKTFSIPLSVDSAAPTVGKPIDKPPAEDVAVVARRVDLPTRPSTVEKPRLGGTSVQHSTLGQETKPRNESTTAPKAKDRKRFDGTKGSISDQPTVAIRISSGGDQSAAAVSSASAPCAPDESARYPNDLDREKGQAGPDAPDYDTHYFKIPKNNVRREWLRRTESNSSYSGKKTFIPQVGDEVVYIPRAHFESQKKFRTYLIPPWRNWPVKTNWPVVRCHVRSIRFRFPYKAFYDLGQRSIVAILKLEITGIPKVSSAFPWPKPSFVAPIGRHIFEVNHFEDAGEDYLCPLGLYISRLSALEVALSAVHMGADIVAYYTIWGDSRCDDRERTFVYGRAIGVSANKLTEADAHLRGSGFQAVEVEWSDGNRDFLSPWDVDVRGQDQRQLYRPRLTEEEKRRVQSVLGKIRGTPEFGKCLSASVDSGHLERIEVPMDLKLIATRLESDYYSSRLSVAADIKLIRDNLVKYRECADVCGSADRMVSIFVTEVLTEDEKDDADLLDPDASINASQVAFNQRVLVDDDDKEARGSSASLPRQGEDSALDDILLRPIDARSHDARVDQVDASHSSDAFTSLGRVATDDTGIHGGERMVVASMPDQGSKQINQGSNSSSGASVSGVNLPAPTSVQNEVYGAQRSSDNSVADQMSGQVIQGAHSNCGASISGGNLHVPTSVQSGAHGGQRSIDTSVVNQMRGQTNQGRANSNSGASVSGGNSGASMSLQSGIHGGDGALYTTTADQTSKRVIQGRAISNSGASVPGGSLPAPTSVQNGVHGGQRSIDTSVTDQTSGPVIQGRASSNSGASISGGNLHVPTSVQNGTQGGERSIDISVADQTSGEVIQRRASSVSLQSGVHGGDGALYTAMADQTSKRVIQGKAISNSGASVPGGSLPAPTSVQSGVHDGQRSIDTSMADRRSGKVTVSISGGNSGAPTSLQNGSRGGVRPLGTAIADQRSGRVVDGTNNSSSAAALSEGNCSVGTSTSYKRSVQMVGGMANRSVDAGIAFPTVGRAASILSGSTAPKGTSNNSVTILLLGDKLPTLSGACKGRDIVTRVTFQTNLISKTLENNAMVRLEKWEPFMKIRYPLCIGLTSNVERSAPPTQAAKTAASISIDLANDSTLSADAKSAVRSACWKGLSPPLKKGNRLMLAMLPVDPTKNKLADCHLWPIGTFLQIDSIPASMKQRKQASHNEAEWHGMSEMLDVGGLVSKQSQRFKISFCSYDPTTFIYVLAVCEFETPEETLKRLTRDNVLFKLSREAAMEKAVAFAHKQAFVIVDDNEENAEAEVGKFVISLTCPISKKLMWIPVRGRNCMHFQCFDLESYVSAGNVVSGTRWRCASCEAFVALQDLEWCGLTTELLEEFRSVASSDRDRLELRADRTYRLLEESTRRQRKRQAAGGDDGPNKRPAKIVEIIEL